jgi:hypothetical protein
MQTLQIDKQNAKKLYPSASPEFKQMLLDTFGETFFSQKITDRVKTYEDACAVLGISSKITGYYEMSEDEINGGWTPDWNDNSQKKWRPWFGLASGFRFGSAYYDCTYSDVGSRLCFKSEELANYAAEQFLGLYKTFFTA